MIRRRFFKHMAEKGLTPHQASALWVDWLKLTLVAMVGVGALLVIALVLQVR